VKADTTHEHWRQVIPWYANGSLSAEERAEAEEHLKTCAACQSEVQWLQNVRISLTSIPEEAPDASASFAKTMAAIDSLEASKTSVPGNWFAGLLNVIWNPPVPMARLVFAAQLILIVALGLYSFRPQRTGPGFTTLSGSEASAGGARLTVNFAPNTTVQQMNDSLTLIGGKIVSGPSALGMYVIELPISAEKDKEIQSVIDRLRANNAIRFVEREP
jgi:Putative zinc-finger